jgi:hypothetical protein
MLLFHRDLRLNIRDFRIFGSEHCFGRALGLGIAVPAVGGTDHNGLHSQPPVKCPIRTARSPGVMFYLDRVLFLF